MITLTLNDVDSNNIAYNLEVSDIINDCFIELEIELSEHKKGNLIKGLINLDKQDIEDLIFILNERLKKLE